MKRIKSYYNLNGLLQASLSDQACSATNDPEDSSLSSLLMPWSSRNNWVAERPPRYQPYSSSVTQFRDEASRVGIVLTYNAAYDLYQRISRRGGNVADWIRNNASRDPTSNAIISRFDQRLGPRPGAAPVPTEADMFISGNGPEAMNTDTNMGGGATNGINTYVNDRTDYKTVRSKRRKLTPMAALLRWMRHNRMDQIYRWQHLEPYETIALRAYYLDKYVKPISDQVLMPMYAFNLSAHPSTRNEVATVPKSMPLYRLVKNTTTSTTGRNYEWKTPNSYTPAQGTYGCGTQNALGVAQNSDYLAYSMVLEHSDHEIKTNISEYCHDWSQIKLMFQGRTSEQSKITIMVVSFLEDGIGPARVTVDNLGAFGAEDVNSTDTEVIADQDYFWDRFWEAKVTHPLAVTKRPPKLSKHFAVHYKDTFVIGMENMTSGNDNRSPLLTKCLFYQNHAVYNVMSAVGLESTSMVTQANQNPGFAVTVSSNSTVTRSHVVSRSADKWLVVYSEDFNPKSTSNPEDITDSVSFDMMIRSKFTLYQTDT